jgi:MscS family membrane protein
MKKLFLLATSLSLVDKGPVEDYTIELKEREAILLQIMDLARDIGVEFAFPTRTLHIEPPSEAVRSEGAAKPRSALGAIVGGLRPA